MTALLDTHTFLWIEGDPARVPASVRAYLTDPAWVVYLSVVSAWEMTIKVDSGKLVLRDTVERIVEEALANTPLQLLPVEARHAYALHGLPGIHKDPFDRMLVAQTLAENAVLLTDDAKIRQYPVRTDW